jgi:hypothetical protein
MSERRPLAMPRSNDQGQGSPPKVHEPAKPSPPPERKNIQKPTSPEKSTDVHGDPETPV